ncbi:MAG: RraA family protein [Firmicutes bacterium]|nr:RraA family protein [Bacillota bacterium]
MSHDVAERLLRLDTCAVSDACDRLGIRAVPEGLHALWGTPKIAGRVVTVKLRASAGEKSTRHLNTAAVEAAVKGDAIVVDAGGRTDAAGWGGLLALAATLKGVAGVVVDGVCRDIDEAREYGFPLFALGTTPQTARGRIIEESYNQPIEVRGVAVYPGDYVLADGSGVVIVPTKHVEEILEIAEQIAAREAAMANEVRQGRSIVEVMGAQYEQMVEKG